MHQTVIIVLVMALQLSNLCQRLWKKLRKKDFIIPSFITPGSQNVIERVEDKDYISPYNNTDMCERVCFEVHLNNPYSMKDGFLQLYLKLVTARNTVLVNLFKETLMKEVKIYKDGSSDVINKNTEHTPGETIFLNRLRSKNKSVNW